MHQWERCTPEDEKSTKREVRFVIAVEWLVTSFLNVMGVLCCLFRVSGVHAVFLIVLAHGHGGLRRSGRSVKV